MTGHSFIYSLLILFSASLCSAFSSNGKNMAFYWGQNSAGSQEDLAYYCKQDAADIMIISFLNGYGSSTTTLTISSCSDTYSDGLAHCSSIGEDIKTCQSLGKKVLLSLGGAISTGSFSSDSQAESYAETLWNMFGGGSGSENRPFDDAIIDGFDFDIESGDETGYVALVNKLRSSYFSSASKTYYISAAPQCPYPDASVGELLSKASVDFAFIQFYNNYCSCSGSSFNWDTWTDYAQNTSPNKDIKLYVGLPGSTSAAGSGYLSDSELSSAIGSVSSSSYFGGVMMWDASQAWANTVDGTTYAQYAYSLVSGSSSSSSSSLSSSSSDSTTSISSTTSTSSAPQTSSTSNEVSTASISLAAKTTAQDVGFAAIEGTDTTSTPSSTAVTISLSSSSSSLFTTTSTRTIIATLVTSTTTSSSSQTVITSTALSVSSAAASQAASTDSACNVDGAVTCIGDDFAQCNYGKWVTFACGAGTVCTEESGTAVCGWPSDSGSSVIATTSAAFVKRHVHHVHRRHD